MDKSTLTIDTQLPVRVMQVTLCSKCGNTDAYMCNVKIIDGNAPLFYKPLHDLGVKRLCWQCSHAEKLKSEAMKWLLQPDFFAPDKNAVQPDDEYMARSIQGYWPAANKYEFIEKAALLIWYDNGMINRQEPEAEKLDLLRKWLEKLDADKLAYIDNVLSRLTEHQLDTVCCGEESEAYALTTADVHVFLDKIVDEEYLNGSI